MTTASLLTLTKQELRQLVKVVLAALAGSASLIAHLLPLSFLSAIAENGPPQGKQNWLLRSFKLWVCCFKTQREKNNL